MCGRFGSSFSAKELDEHFDLDVKPSFEVKNNYNVAPSQQVIGITHNSPLVAKRMNWGFVPTWANPSSAKFVPINARDDKITGGYYRADFSKHRCLILVSWFYEWKRVTLEGKEEKLPFLIKVNDSEIFSLAGIFGMHTDAEGKEHLMMAIITTSPNAAMKPIHNRMPVIISEADYGAYLDEDLSKAKTLLKPFAGKLETYRVSEKVNNPKNNDKSLMKKI